MPHRAAPRASVLSAGRKSKVDMRSVEAVSKSKAVRVALVLPLEHFYARGILLGIQKAIYPHNLSVALEWSAAQLPKKVSELPWVFSIHGGSPRGKALEQLCDDLSRWKPDMVIGRIEDAELAEFLRGFKAPVIEIYSEKRWDYFVTVDLDDQAVGVAAASHFINRGFRHFAFLGSFQYGFVQDRAKGFQSQLTRVDAAEDAEPPEHSSFTYHEFNCHSITPNTTVEYDQLGAVGDWLESLPKPVAIMAARDSWGLLVAHAAFERGIHIPEEVALLAVDNDPVLCEYCSPPLSSVNQNPTRVGAEAVRLGHLLLEKSAPMPPAVLVEPGEVSVRLSSDILAVPDAAVAAAFRYIRDNIRAGINVKTLLQAVPVNRRKLERDFRRLLGRSLQDEIHRVRLQLIKRMLTTEMSVRAIAAATGFSSAQYLSTFFYGETGLTPREYRCQQGGGKASRPK